MDRREEMRRCLSRRERRGLTFRELSLETGVPVGTLASWAWKLRQERLDTKRPRARAKPKFVELVPARSESSGRIEIVVRGDRRVIVDGTIDEAELSRIVTALERC